MSYWKEFNRADNYTLNKLDALSRETDESGYIGPFDLWVRCKRVSPAGDVVTDDGVRLADCWFDPDLKQWMRTGGTVEILVEGGRRFVTHYAVPFGPHEENDRA